MKSQYTMQAQIPLSRDRERGRGEGSTGATPTSYHYTGQRSEIGALGLYFYGARY
jgi:hypothetical protein